MHRLYILLIVFCQLGCRDNVSKTLYVGTYTKGESEGIYQLQWHPKTGMFGTLKLAAATSNPSFLARSFDRKTLYAVNENEAGTVSAFHRTPQGELQFINKVTTEGAHPCHVALSPSNRMAVVSNYTGGHAALYTVKSDGGLSKPFQILDHRSGHVESHVHSSQFYKNHLYVSDLGKNSLYDYVLDKNRYKLRDSAFVAPPPRSGPRHFSITQNGRFIYLINELNSSITVAERQGDDFKVIENVSTLAPHFNGKSYCADIHLSKDEHFVYGSNRGENTIVVFKRDTSTGRLSQIQNISTHGDWPRHFTLDPTGQFLLVANQKSNSITAFKRDTETGMLRYVSAVTVPSPVCLLF